MAEMDVRPIGDKILIRKVKAKEKTEGGLFIPSNAANPTQLAEVLAAGPGRLHDRPIETAYVGEEDGKRVLLPSEKHTFQPMSVKPGDFILHGRFAGHEVEVNQRTLWLLREEEVLAVVSGPGLAEMLEDDNSTASSRTPTAAIGRSQLPPQEQEEEDPAERRRRLDALREGADGEF